MSLWWLQPGWKETRCSSCGEKIWPEGDPDWGKCYGCLTKESQKPPERTPTCDICLKAPAVTSSNGKNVCSEECFHRANEPSAQNGTEATK